jgi:hypothetical protein
MRCGGLYVALADICGAGMIFVKVFVGVSILLEGVSGFITVNFTFIA